MSILTDLVTGAIGGKGKKTTKKSSLGSDIIDGISDQVKARARIAKNKSLKGNPLGALVSDSVVDNLVESVENTIRKGLQGKK